MYFERKCSGSHSDKHELLKFPCRQIEIKIRSIKRCSFVWVFLSSWRTFPSYGDVTIYGEGLQIFTWRTRHPWPSSSEGSLACHKKMWHGTSLYNGHLRGLMTLTPVAECLAVERSLAVLTTYRSVAAGIWTTNLPHARRTLYKTAPLRRPFCYVKHINFNIRLRIALPYFQPSMSFCCKIGKKCKWENYL